MTTSNSKGTRTLTSTLHATRRALLGLLALALLGALLAACGSSSSSSSSSTSSGGGGTSRTALTACLRKHGVTLPSGNGAPAAGGAPSGGGAPPAGGSGTGTAPSNGGTPPAGFSGAGGSKLQAAMKACGAKLPSGRQSATFSRQGIQKYVTCVRKHGYDLPNPNYSGHGSVFPASIRSNSKFKTASRPCQSLLRPAGGSAPPGA